MIDMYYSNFDKSSFYLGMISKVQRYSSVLQVENLSLLSTRLLGSEDLTPATIDYLVVIDSCNGLFVGNVVLGQVKSSDNVHVSMNLGKNEDVFPEFHIELIGIIKNNSSFIELPGFLSAGIGDKVYIANNIILEKFTHSIENNDTNEDALPSFGSLANYKDFTISLKPSSLFNRHFLVIGTTGSGKSTSSLAILDKLIQMRKKVLIVDATGEYKDTFSENEVEKIVLGVNTAIRPGSLSISQWVSFLEASPGIQAPSLMRAIHSLSYQKQNNFPGVFNKIGQNIAEVQRCLATVQNQELDFDLSLLPSQLVQESVEESRNNSRREYIESVFILNANQILIERIKYKLTLPEFCSFFGANRPFSLLDKIDDFLGNEKNLYIDASQVGTSDITGAMIVDLVSKRLLNTTIIEPKSFVFFIDEVHRYTNSSLSSENIFFDGLSAIAREGRKKGQYLFLTTQNPSDVSKTILSQMGMLLVHRLTQPDELYAIKNFLDERTLPLIKRLGRGEAILSGVNLIQDLQIQINKTTRMHKNDSPLL